MVTTKTPAPEKIPHLFVGPRASAQAKNYLMLNGNAVFEAAAAEVDGFDDVVTAARRARVAKPSFRGASMDELEQRALDAIFAGTDPLEAAEHLHDEQRKREKYDIAFQLLTAADADATSQAISWMERMDTQKALAAALLDRLQAVVERARPIAEALGSTRTYEAARRDPDAAANITRFGLIADDFHAIEQVVRALTVSSLYPESDWPRADLFADFEKVWPTFWRRRSFRWDAQNGHPVVIPAEPEPWSGMDSGGMLFFILDRDAKLWVPTEHELRAKQQKLQEQVEPMRAKYGPVLVLNDAEQAAVRRAGRWPKP